MKNYRQLRIYIEREWKIEMELDWNHSLIYFRLRKKSNDRLVKTYPLFLRHTQY